MSFNKRKHLLNNMPKTRDQLMDTLGSGALMRGLPWMSSVPIWRMVLNESQIWTVPSLWKVQNHQTSPFKFGFWMMFGSCHVSWEKKMCKKKTHKNKMVGSQRWAAQSWLLHQLSSPRWTPSFLSLTLTICYPIGFFAALRMMSVLKLQLRLRVLHSQ